MRFEKELGYPNGQKTEGIRQIDEGLRPNHINGYYFTITSILFFDQEKLSHINGEGPDQLPPLSPSH